MSAAFVATTALSGNPMKQIELPRTSERIIGLTFPENGKLYICDYDEVHEITLGEPVTSKVTTHKPYEFLGKHPLGLGVIDTPPKLISQDNEISYNFDPTAKSVDVRYSISKRTGTITFPTLSGDWFVASFSPDGRHLVLAEPYDYALYSVD